jgi:hypothetical protein
LFVNYFLSINDKYLAFNKFSRKSGGRPPHSKTLARLAARPLVSAKRLGLRQSSGAFNAQKLPDSLDRTSLRV